MLILYLRMHFNLILWDRDSSIIESVSEWMSELLPGSGDSVPFASPDLGS